MLEKCPECELPVSDKAITCPHCGYPLKEFSQKSPPRKKSSKRRRLPNGFGQITKIEGKNLRKPYRAMVTVGKTSTGRPICKLLKPQSYFETYNEAYEALIEFNKNPYDLDPSITLEALYSKWSENYFDTLSSANSIRSITAAWAYCWPLYGSDVRSLRIRHLKTTIENAHINEKDGSTRLASDGTKSRMKSLFNLLFDYAVEYEIVDKNYAREFSISNQITRGLRNSDGKHIAFNPDELTKLWNSLNSKRYSDMLLINCYTGWRPQELLNLKLSDINFENWTMTGGLKTDAGINRTIPIHSKIKNLILERKAFAESVGCDFLFASSSPKKKGNPMNYKEYSNYFNKTITELNLNPEHRPHDCRKTFVTEAKKVHMDEYALKRIIGHAITDITEKIYTERDIEWLASEIEKLK